ncbi:MAG: hypothetical protein ACJAZX_001466 [Rickettsiales bacterium]|jgi:hypothetical protein
MKNMNKISALFSLLLIMLSAPLTPVFTEGETCQPHFSKFYKKSINQQNIVDQSKSIAETKSHL